MNKIHKFSFHVAQTFSSVDVQLSPLLQCQWRLRCVHEELRSRINSGIAYYDSVQNLFKPMCHKSFKHNHIYGNDYMLRSTQTTIKSLLQKLST